MNDEITIFEKLFLAQLKLVPELAACVGTRIVNSKAPAGTNYPFAVFTVIPLNDNTGQARTSIQTRGLVDLKICAKFPLSPSVATAISAVKEHFRASLTYDAESCRISIRHERPISFLAPGPSPDEEIVHRGGSYRWWLSRV